MHVSEDAKLLVQYPYRHDREHLELLGSVLPKIRCFYIYNVKNQRIACAYYRHGSNPRPTVLYSCSRNQDIGLAIDDIASYSTQLDMDVFVYDYAGCGLSEGSRKEQHLYDNIEFVYEQMTKRLGVKCEEVRIFPDLTDLAKSRVIGVPMEACAMLFIFTAGAPFWRYPGQTSKN